MTGFYLGFQCTDLPEYQPCYWYGVVLSCTVFRKRIFHLLGFLDQFTIAGLHNSVRRRITLIFVSFFYVLRRNWDK